MKLDRLKKVRKFLTYYCNNFGFRVPYQLLVDATFCVAALQNKVAIEEQMRKYLQQDINLITTHCVIIESESLGPKLIGATSIIKQCKVHKCGHEGNPIPANACLLSMIKKSQYIVATQDRKLQRSLRESCGQPLLYLHKAAPTLDPPSKNTKNFLTKKLQSISREAVQKVIYLKKQEGSNEGHLNRNFKPKRRKPKNPNPLSCKKKKSVKEKNKRHCNLEK